MEQFIVQNIKTGEVFGKKTHDSQAEAAAALKSKKGADKQNFEVRVIPDPQQLGEYVQQRIHDDHRPGYYMGISQIVGYVQEYITNQKIERKGDE